MSPTKKKSADERLADLASAHAREHGLEYSKALLQVYENPKNIDLVVEYERERRPLTPDQISELRDGIQRHNKRKEAFEEKERKILERRRLARKHPLYHPDPLGHRTCSYPDRIPNEDEISDDSWFQLLRRELTLAWCNNVEKLVNDKAKSESGRFKDLAKALKTNVHEAALWYLERREERLWQLRLLAPGNVEGTLYKTYVLAKTEWIIESADLGDANDDRSEGHTPAALLTHDVWALLEQAVLLRLNLDPEDPPEPPWEPDVLGVTTGIGDNPLLRREPMSQPSFYVRGLVIPWYWGETTTIDAARRVQRSYKEELKTFLGDALRMLAYEFASVRSIRVVYGQRVDDLMSHLRLTTAQPLRAPGGRGRSRTAILYHELARAKIPEIRRVIRQLRERPKRRSESWDSCAARLNAPTNTLKAVTRVAPKGMLGPFHVLRTLYRLDATAQTLQRHYHTRLSRKHTSSPNRL